MTARPRPTGADELGVLSIIRLRTPPPDALLDALIDGGVRAVEVTVPTPGGLDTVRRWGERAAEAGVLLGAGTVRTVDDVHGAADAGARFLVTPSTDEGVLAAAESRGLPVASGALTPGEIEAAARSGARWVKVFPVDAVGGPRYLRAVAAPLHDLSFLPTGGVDVEATRIYGAQPWCSGVGVGGALVSDGLVAEGRWNEITARAAAFVTAWAEGRSEAR